MRLFAFSWAPPGVYFDEAFNGHLALNVLDSRHISSVYFQREMGLPGLYFWLLSLSFAVFGDSITALRFPNALMSIFTVLGIYLLVKELFHTHVHRQWIALIAAALLATSVWHIILSRLAFSGSMVPFMEIYSIWLLAKAIRTKKPQGFIAAGAFIGLGFYSYWQFYPFAALPLWMLYRFVKEDSDARRYMFVFCAAMLMVMLPLMITATELNIFERPRHLFIASKENQVGFFQGISQLLHNFSATITMLFSVGDGNWRHNYNAQSQLSTLAIIGIFYWVVTGISPLCPHKTPSDEPGHILAIPQQYLLIIWALLATLPAILTNEGVPNAWRANGMIVPVYVLASIGLYRLFYRPTILVQYGTFLFLLLFAWHAAHAYHIYFLKWAKDYNTIESFDTQDPSGKKFDSLNTLYRFGFLKDVRDKEWRNYDY
ncbi:MAG: glycosyltransferase family 39 protein [Rickettsiales bacterium]|nr:glycosyltransferase family 39 protein [Rickettsiales bacterium]